VAGSVSNQCTLLATRFTPTMEGQTRFLRFNLEIPTDQPATSWEVGLYEDTGAQRVGSTLLTASTTISQTSVINMWDFAVDTGNVGTFLSPDVPVWLTLQARGTAVIERQAWWHIVYNNGI